MSGDCFLVSPTNGSIHPATTNKARLSQANLDLARLPQAIIGTNCRAHDQAADTRRRYNRDCPCSVLWRAHEYRSGSFHSN